jgi:hypothetical protein
MNLFLRGIVFLLLCFCCTSSVLAHAVAVNLDVFMEKNDLVVLMNGVQGEPINGASLAFSVLSGSGEIAGGVLKPVADGEYRALVPNVLSDLYTLKLRDTTFPAETLEVARTVQFPLLQTVRLLLPASKIGQPNLNLLVVLATLPVVLALIALALVLLFRPKKKEEEVES